MVHRDSRQRDRSRSLRAAARSWACCRLHGLESGDDLALRSLRKGLRVEKSLEAIKTLEELEIFPSAGFIMFRPDTTLDEVSRNLDFLETVGCVEITALVTSLRVYTGTGVEADLRRRGLLRGTYDNYEWSFIDRRVGEIYHGLLRSADTLATSYNAFASFRRRGLISFRECIRLQRAMNARPIAIARDLVRGVAADGGASPDLLTHVRSEFKAACEDFLRLLRVVEIYSVRRDLPEGFRLLSPMYLC